MKTAARDGRRHLILHYHFFKNAGTTIESVLQQSFRERMVRFDSDDHNSVISNNALLAFLQEHTDTVAVTSHHLRPPKPDDQHFVFHDIVFLRHPLARLWSTYEFYRRMDVGKDPLAAVAKDRNAPEFFRLLMSEYPRHASNTQVNLVANGGDKLPVPGDLNRAMKMVSDASILGTAEDFDQSAVVGEQALCRTFAGVDFSYVAQNVSSGQVRSLDAQLAHFEKICGKDLFDRLVDANQLDVALHRAASEEVHRRFKLLPSPEQKLKEFQQRCRKRERGAATIVIASNHPADFAFYANMGVQ